MKTLLLVAFVLTGMVFKNTIAEILEVPNEYSAIQSAISASTNGDTILVAPGTYFENINFEGKNILVTSHYLQNKDVSFISNTIINGSQPGHPDTASCVLFINGETNNAILQGFTLTGGKGTRWQDIHIGGFYREGGGVLIELSSPMIQFNYFTGNDATDKTNCVSAGGGAIRCGDGDPVIQNNVIAQNQGRYGAGIVINFSTGTIRNNLILENTGGIDYGGGGIWSYAGGSTTIENNTVVNNHSDLDGGGILIWSTSATIRNNIIRANTAVSLGSQIRARSGGTANVTYSNVEGGWSGIGNIDVVPYFEASKFYLSDSSLCIDAGDPDSLYNDTEDTSGMALWPSKGNIRNDMGAYGGPNSAELSDYVITHVEDEDSIIELPKGFNLEQNYPNPFNPTTTIKYSIPAHGFVKFRVFNIRGQEVRELVSEFKNAGEHEVSFDAAELSSGIYFYRLKVDEFNATRKMILLE